MENNYWNCLKELDLFADVTPTNIGEEKEKFFSAVNKGEKYNPIFTYKYTRISSDVMKLEEVFKYTPQDADISPKYWSHFEKDKQWITTFMQRNVANFPQLLAKLYPLPSKEYQLLAHQLLSDNGITEASDNDELISAEEALVIFEKTLKDAGYSGWQVVLKPIGAKAMVSSLRKELTIREGHYFKISEIERLKVHEIHTHIRRFENGTKQPYALFRYGFPDYLETEEGLAIYNEEINKVLTALDLKKYALRVMACVWADNGSLYDVYAKLREFTTENDSWEIAMRVKRGLIDTSVKGGFYKDQLYFIGYQKVRQLSPEIREKLWIGKVGIADVE
jgi:hypothetical protein